MGWNKKTSLEERNNFFQRTRVFLGTENSGVAYCGPGAPWDIVYVVLEISPK